MNRLLAIIALCFCVLPARAEPGRHWQSIDPVSAGWSATALQPLRDYAELRKPTALLLVQNGALLASFGDPARKVGVASVRKSLLSALYGDAVADGRIKLDATLAELGVDEKAPGLTEQEKGATVRDLLTARSGIYLPAAHETPDIKEKRPLRGSHPPGTFWFYNNWDFNAPSTIYRQRTGEDIFESFARHIAAPIGMEDFSAKDGRYALSPVSLHPAYPFRLSARDLARFGVLFANGGSWEGRQLIPAGWVGESTARHSASDRPGRGYGYMWWTLPEDGFGKGAALASGYDGQQVAVIPGKRLVLVQTAESGSDGKGQRTRDFIAMLRKIVASAP
ncbi:MAG: serine hydrolase [Bosea sp.]|uniref:serine hydrolase domain-containing protein n=1 Tax=Bosea sp. (in: a-proteobacteria) TaxID=1871050 RepID=UPI0023882E93|nr:serine hydrolase [Bosea sp. (in: a-proteobacteria)]MCP4735609.1 serine hydrolase [Bosea sp. (in: a-proteobacteria)]